MGLVSSLASSLAQAPSTSIDVASTNRRKANHFMLRIILTTRRCATPGTLFDGVRAFP
ncbi:MAG: hypothetical protein QOI34_1537 [Verrucomicrobiota bacterium]